MKFACIGDIHGFWHDSDTKYFNQSDYDFLLLTGDLPNHRPFSLGRKNLYRKLNALAIPTYMCLGNWDGSNYLQLIGEVLQSPWMIRLGGVGHRKRVDRLKQELSSLHIGMYELKMSDSRVNSPKNTTNQPKSKVAILFGRPFSCGGPHLGFYPTLKKLYGISSLSDSVEIYKNTIDSCVGNFESLIILSHNGPTGLGDKATSIYGCDFRKDEGDWGDPDLEEAISYAKSLGLHIPLVVSGHMHHRNPKTKSEREWLVQKVGTTYLNAAKVPRNGSYYSVDMDGSEINVKLNYTDRSV